MKIKTIVKSSVCGILLTAWPCILLAKPITMQCQGSKKSVLLNEKTTYKQAQECMKNDKQGNRDGRWYTRYDRDDGYNSIKYNDYQTRERLDLKFNESTGRLYQVEVNYGMNRSRYDD